MSEHSTPEERTEHPTARRMSQLRKQGALHISTDLVQVLSLITGFWMLTKLVDGFYQDLKQVLLHSFSMIADNEPFTSVMMQRGLSATILVVMPRLFLLFLTISVVATLAVMLQTDWNIKEQKIKFNFNLINPIAGFQRVFSINGLVNTVKALLKLALIAPIGFFALKGFAPRMVLLMHLSIPQVMNFVASAMDILFWRIMYVLIPLAIADWGWGKFQWLKTNKMTKPEVKDERKAVEGDEETRKRIQRKAFERALQRLHKSVPQADVVITNPTHFAVALKYERNKMNAPIVVAKGADFLALRIREIAKESRVPILERKSLARALYESTAIGAEIPHALFKAVAEVLAYVYRLKNPYAYNQVTQ